MGDPTASSKSGITTGDHERMKSRVRAKWEPKLRALAREQRNVELAGKAMRLISGVNLPSADDVYAQKLRDIHTSIQREINLLPGPTPPPLQRSKVDTILNKMPTRVRNYIKRSIDKQGVIVTDQTTLQWMADVVSSPEDRMPSVKGVGITLER